MRYSGASALLLSLSVALPVLALPSPEFSKRDDCHSDNCLRNLRDSRYSAKASTFCSTYIPAASTVTVQSTITSRPPTVTSTVTGAGPTITVTVQVDNTALEVRREVNEFEDEDPIEDDLERRELYLDDTLEEIEDVEIQERILQPNVTTPTSTTTRTAFSSTTTTSATVTTTPPLTTSPATTSGLPSYASACNVGSTIDPSRVSSACACLITSRPATTTVTATVTSGAAPTTTVTVPGPTTTATTTTYASCSSPHYHTFQQFNLTAPNSVARNYSFPDSSPHSKDACCNACYGTENCFAFLYLAADARDDASCRLFTTDRTGNPNASLAVGGAMCPAGEYRDPGVGLAPGESGYEYGPCNRANDFASY